MTHTIARRLLAGHHVMLVIRRARPPRGAVAARARRAARHVQPQSSGRPFAARLAWRSSRWRAALGELGGEGEDLPVRPVVELDLADQAALAVGEDGRAAHRVALESPLPLQVGPARVL